MSPAQHLSRLTLCAALATLSALPPTASAQVSEWEFFVPREREFSHTRRHADTMEIRFGDAVVDARRSWARLSDAEQAAVRAVQSPALTEADEPPYPKVGLKPLIERLHRVRGPAGQTLRVYFEVDELGSVSAVATAGGKTTPDFAGQLLALTLGSGFKAGTCNGQPCKRLFAFDIRYVGS
ncbi:MAG: hypothetical protein KA387_04650 [Rubrivivax sp.]|nr:hypothetical protein [Rubrivivax sp.]